MKILAAVNGSPSSFNTLKTACLIAGKTHFSVLAFYVDKGQTYTPELTRWPFIQERLSRELKNLGHEVIRKAYEIGREMEVPVEGIISTGIPAVEILEYTKAHGIVKLIALAHGSKGKGAQQVVESTAKYVVAQGTTPVLVTSNEVDIKRIVLPINHIAPSNLSVQFGAHLARSLRVPVTIICTVPDIEALLAEYGYVGNVFQIKERRSVQNSERLYREQAAKTVEIVTASLNTLNVEASSVIKKGDTVTEVIEEASKSDLILIPHSEKKAQKKLSSIANKLLDTPSLNVIFVHG